MSRFAVILTLAAVLAGCGRKPSEEECTRAFDHMIELMKADETTAGAAGMMEGMKGRLVEECRKGSKKELECIMKAKVLEEARACGGQPARTRDASEAAAPTGATAPATAPPVPAEKAGQPEMEFEPEQPE